MVVWSRVGPSRLSVALRAVSLPSGAWDLNLPGLREPREPRRATVGEGTTLKGDFRLQPEVSGDPAWSLQVPQQAAFLPV